LLEPEGLLAAGGDLTPEWLVEAYALGIFPWFERDEDPIYWWSPAERAVMRPGSMRVTRSLSKRIRNAGFRVSFDCSFDSVIEACARFRAASFGTWITPKMQAAYCELHRCGVAHSVEIWQAEDLVGGLYGVSLGSMFFGESMFSAQADASKIAFYHLDQRLQAWNFTLLDCQMMTPHLASLGVAPMARADFMQLLQHNDLEQTRLGCWQLDDSVMKPQECCS
jgi:leucyl/phenylalanyl-tRNA--protein transferase